jgi:hypothetical protein
MIQEFDDAWRSASCGKYVRMSRKSALFVNACGEPSCLERDADGGMINARYWRIFNFLKQG